MLPFHRFAVDQISTPRLSRGPNEIFIRVQWDLRIAIMGRRSNSSGPDDKPHFMVGIENSAPSFTPLGQREVMVLVLV